MKDEGKGERGRGTEMAKVGGGGDGGKRGEDGGKGREDEVMDRRGWQ